MVHMKRIFLRIFFAFIIVAIALSVHAQNCSTKSSGDADCSGAVNLIDFELWRREFSKIVTSTQADFNNDTKVDLIDFEIWRRSFVAGGSGNPTATPGAASPTPGSNPTGKFYIVGKDVVGPDGNIFIPVGGNMSGIWFWTSPIETAQKASNAKRWGWTAIRLNGRVSDFGTVNGWLGRASTWADYDNIINAYSTQKIAVMIANHDITANDPVSQQAAITTFYVAAAQRYKDNPYVWFNITNEPYSTSTSTQQAQFVTFSKAVLAAIRATGAENIVMPGAVDNGNDYTNFNAKMGGQIANGQCNVLFDVHPYFRFSSQSNADTYVSDIQNAGLAVVFGEYGIPYPPGSEPLPGVPSLTYTLSLNSNTYAYNVAKSKHIGMLIWHGTTPSGVSTLVVTTANPGYFDAVDNWTNPTNLTIGGQMLWDLAHQASPGKFTGSLAGSNCPSAK
jgi:mannan endo-1,4-beta-mannosidase